ncbi:MAG: (Na+)-NQR maturation NqrM [Azoarcus sp.]|jgi:hypothetical protein|nr:(Na+)-NQR maturation NqrM [Azoarcus sp.]
MNIFLITLAIVAAVVILMAIGVLFGRKPIAGSCGGLALLGMKCDCENPCPKKLARMGQTPDAEILASESKAKMDLESAPTEAP